MSDRPTARDDLVWYGADNSHADRIIGFESAFDVLRTGFVPVATLVVGADSVAAESEPVVVYGTDTGRLSCDMDGEATLKADLAAVLVDAPSLGNDNLALG